MCTRLRRYSTGEASPSSSRRPRGMLRPVCIIATLSVGPDSTLFEQGVPDGAPPKLQPRRDRAHATELVHRPREGFQGPPHSGTDHPTQPASLKRPTSQRLSRADDHSLGHPEDEHLREPGWWPLRVWKAEALCVSPLRPSSSQLLDEPLDPVTFCLRLFDSVERVSEVTKAAARLGAACIRPDRCWI